MMIWKPLAYQGMKTAYVHRPFEYGREKLFDIAEVDDYKGDSILGYCFSWFSWFS